MRTITLVGLCKEVLGPRDGPFELLTEDPRTEYVTGVLRPEPRVEHARATTDPDGDAPEIAGPSQEDDDDDDDDIFVGTSLASPSIDPSQPPRSLGVSFIVGGSRPTIRVCATWARYLAEDGGWRRRPDHFLTEWLDATVTQRSFPHDLVELRVETSALQTGERRVSVYLINNRQETEHGRRGPTEHIFQPQIRVQLGENCNILPMRGAVIERGDPSEDSLELLYSRREAYARGHMCGAIWREIDPERDAGPFEASRPQEAPFAFVDAHLLVPEDSVAFSPADVRTDFLPMYGIEAPETAWQDIEPAPILTAGTLAEIWTPDDIEAALRPLERGYLRWIEDQERRLVEVPESRRPAAQANLQQCRALAERLDGAIELLKGNEEVRLAFCFANRAMALQGYWTRQLVLAWRPFQLAFLLITLRSAAFPEDPSRALCDLLWFPTGGGKTEAYLALAAFTLAYRRLRSEHGDGTGVISRYTLRLLSIQQFRRALSTITACELLRVEGLDRPDGTVGWRPSECPRPDTFIWGGTRFATGLWVGGNVTPNRMDTMMARIDNRIHIFLGALDLLRGARPGYRGSNPTITNLVQTGRVYPGGEPAQVVNCPCCHAILAVPEGSSAGGGLSAGPHQIHMTHAGPGQRVDATRISPPDVGVQLTEVETRSLGDAFVTTLSFTVADEGALSADRLDEWWNESMVPALAPGDLLCVRPARPGYVLVQKDGPRSAVVGFEILCPDPTCELNRRAWAENVPVLRSATRVTTIADRSYCAEGHAPLPSLHGYWQDPPLREGRISARVFGRIPIPAHTVDEQVYSKCPSLIVATADKFARLAFEPRAASIFGNVERYHARFGYYRPGAWQPSDQQRLFRPNPPGGPGGHGVLHTNVPPMDPPDLIIQDELHLIEGPLGSMVGLYETAVDALGGGVLGRLPGRAKYVASTATVRQAGPQVQALFNRGLAQFPPQGLTIDDSFFAITSEPHPLDEHRAGRLYVGLAAPGKGAQTPIVRIWSSLLQSATQTRRAPPQEDADRLWTLAGYFNAVRELAGAATLYRQDIPERLRHRYGARARSTDLSRYMELSSRVDSVELPGMLDALQAAWGVDVVCATSMFGTGVDIDRLGLMVIHGQPKTTSTYIQATGRVGRRSGALVLTFLRASRPRDLDHYEFFCGYHRALYKHVEPITVSPFAPKARERCLGPISVALLRQAATLEDVTVDPAWRVEQRLAGQNFHSEAIRMADHRHDPEVETIVALFERRSQTQPEDIRPLAGLTRIEAAAELDEWQRLARRAATRNDLVYYEPAVARPPVREVVLGDPQHTGANLSQAFENAPQSLRAIEETTTFRI